MAKYEATYNHLFTTDSAHPTTTDLEGVITIANSSVSAGDIASIMLQSNEGDGSSIIRGKYSAGRSTGGGTRGFTAISTRNSGGSMVEAFRIEDNQNVGIGTNKVGLVSATDILHLAKDEAYFVIFSEASSDSAGSILQLKKSRGTHASPSDVLNNDVIGTIRSNARSTTFFDVAKIDFRVDSGVSAAQRPATAIDFYVNSNNASPVVAVTINNLGTLKLTASTTARATLNVPHGSAPTTPVDGDFWTTSSGAFIRINGVTKTFTLT